VVFRSELGGVVPVDREEGRRARKARATRHATIETVPQMPFPRTVGHWHTMKTRHKRRAPRRRPTSVWGQVTNKADADQWMIQAGIVKNWTGLGNTSIYGEYSISNDWGAGTGDGRDYNINPTSGAACVTGFTGTTGFTPPGASSVCDVTSTKLTVWGLGIVQNLDAAAMELYAGWRRFDARITADDAGGTQTRLNTKDADFVFSGARVKF